MKKKGNLRDSFSDLYICRSTIPKTLARIEAEIIFEYCEARSNSKILQRKAGKSFKK